LSLLLIETQRAKRTITSKLFRQPLLRDLEQSFLLCALILGPISTARWLLLALAGCPPTRGGTAGSSTAPQEVEEVEELEEAEEAVEAEEVEARGAQGARPRFQLSDRVRASSPLRKYLISEWASRETIGTNE
jgi:hypothetical protein